jgi:hypothetical protein
MDFKLFKLFFLKSSLQVRVTVLLVAVDADIALHTSVHALHSGRRSPEDFMSEFVLVPIVGNFPQISLFQLVRAHCSIHVITRTFIPTSPLTDSALDTIPVSVQQALVSSLLRRFKCHYCFRENE